MNGGNDSDWFPYFEKAERIALRPRQKRNKRNPPENPFLGEPHKQLVEVGRLIRTSAASLQLSHRVTTLLKASAFLILSRSPTSAAERPDKTISKQRTLLRKGPPGPLLFINLNFLDEAFEGPNREKSFLTYFTVFLRRSSAKSYQLSTIWPPFCSAEEMANGEDGVVIYYITCGSLGYCAEASCLSGEGTAEEEATVYLLNQNP
ncbi:hypothetical protein DBV15_10803 [Temnothorax longispinosus]|uniref:Uncharacterized protein n=1 Tax=Temnothorax longispinosus TaxID=300112 RepID=A0A4S2KFX4_9HYME|nr:hypothetical protein DBV15_10803 [Temnothorax longispinosus]